MIVSETLQITPGTIIARHYRADKRLGMGGMGEVWSGIRLDNNRPVAIKVLLTAVSSQGEIIARFKREAQVLARIRSEFVAEVLDFSTDPSFGLVLIMELIPGVSLHQHMSSEQCLGVEEVLDIASDVLYGLRDLHAANIVHRDLKPGNIVLRPRENGERPRATLIDFGVSRIISGPEEEDEVTAITRGDRVLGTLEYMAPEQIIGSRTASPAADLYALGALMFRAIMGQHVFGALTEGKLAVAKLQTQPTALETGRSDEVAKRAEALVARLLGRRLRDRYATATEALEAIEPIRQLYAKAPQESLEDEDTDDEDDFETLCFGGPGVGSSALALSVTSARLAYGHDPPKSSSFEAVVPELAPAPQVPSFPVPQAKVSLALEVPVAVETPDPAPMQEQSSLSAQISNPQPQNKTPLWMSLGLVALFGAIGVALVVAIMSSRRSQPQVLSQVTSGLRVPVAITLRVQRTVQNRADADAASRGAGGSPP